jgi:hypothetical protein
MEQMQFTPPAFFPKVNVVCLPQRKVIPISDPSLVPLHYPPATTPIPPQLAQAPALFFPPALKPMVINRAMTSVTAEQVLQFLVPPPGISKIDYFLTIFNVPRFAVENEAIIKRSIHSFLDAYALKEGTNGLCNFRHLWSRNEPFQFTIPANWSYITQHPTLQLEYQRHQYATVENHDWST